MASVSAVKFLLCLVLWLFNSQTLCQGEKNNWYANRYSFIKKASSFSSSSSSSSSISSTGSNDEYDYIIVGGGTAGCPLGATLGRYFTFFTFPILHFNGWCA